MRLSYSNDPTLSGRIFEMLETAFPGIRRTAQNAARLGGAWESVSTPFVHFEGGHPVSHIGVIQITLVLLGDEVRVGSLHAVATHPNHRRRGHYRGLMQEVLRDCAGRYDTLILTTDHPEYYKPFGFRVLQEHLSTIRNRFSGRPGDLRTLNLGNRSDVVLMNRLLDTREPVSQVVGARDEKAIFCFNEGKGPLYYSPSLDVMICMEIEGARLILYDVVGPRLPSLDSLLSRIPARVDELAVNFSIDRFATKAEATPRIFDHNGPSYLMARGPFAAEYEKFTLPRSART